MSEAVTIKNSELSAVIDTEGTWLQTFTAAGRPILFPKQILMAADGTEKTRGGCHVCLPNFGPGGDSGLKQHGFGREEPWYVLQQTNGAAATFENRQTDGAYAGLLSQLTYTLGDAALTMDLALQNTGDDELRVTPGFHPYFMVEASSTVSIDGVVQDLTRLGTALELTNQPTSLVIDETNIALRSENLPNWILWTDQLGQYVCLEPTFAGFSFEHPAQPAEMLEPGKQRNYALTIGIL